MQVFVLTKDILKQLRYVWRDAPLLVVLLGPFYASFGALFDLIVLPLVAINWMLVTVLNTKGTR